MNKPLEGLAADKGWGYKPTDSATRLKALEAGKLGKASAVIAAAYNDGMKRKNIINALNSQEFISFFNGQINTPDKFAVGYLTQAEKVIFKCDGDTVWLSRASLDEHKLKHPEVTLEDYQQIPHLLHDAQVWVGAKERRYLLLIIHNKPYRAAIKTDAEGKAMWFLSLVISGKQKPPKGAVRVR